MVFVTVLGISILLLTAYLSSPSATAGGRLAGVKVCIDPGHGGEDPGAVAYGLKESDINLDVSQALATLLSGRGRRHGRVDA
jgi:N-acetylmuramoyl-L-alanine amidase